MDTTTSADMGRNGDRIMSDDELRLAPMAGGCQDQPMSEEVLIRLRNARDLVRDATIELQYACSSATDAVEMAHLYSHMHAAEGFDLALTNLLLRRFAPYPVRLIIGEP